MPPYQPLAQETTFQQYQTPAAPAVETQRAFEVIKSRQEEQQQFGARTPAASYDFNRNNLPEPSRLIEVSSQTLTKSPSLTSNTTSIEILREVAKAQPLTPVQEAPKPPSFIPPVQSQPSAGTKVWYSEY